MGMRNQAAKRLRDPGSLGLTYAASGEMTLETAAFIRSDCVLTPTAPLRKRAEIGAGNPHSLRRGFVLTLLASLAVGRIREPKCLRVLAEPSGSDVLHW